MAWDGSSVVVTPRLILRTYRVEDLPIFAELNADPAVYQTLGGQPLTRVQSDEIAEWAEECFEKEGLGLLAIERRSDGRFLGMSGLHHQASLPDEVEVAWRLAREFWGNGYATEAGRGWMTYGFRTLGLTEIISTTDLENPRSLAVMKRLGMVFSREAQIVDEGMTFDAVVYSLSVDRWQDEQPGPAAGGAAK